MSTRSTADSILALTPDGTDRFIGTSDEANHIGVVFGGRLAAQALAAAMRTVEAMPASSLHAYFLAPASPEAPIAYQVERLRDSRRFANRQVTAVQRGVRVFTLLCQFHAPEPGYAHQAAMAPPAPPPEDVPPLQDFVRAHEHRIDVSAIRNFSGPLPVELRVIEPEANFFARGERPERRFWFRLPSAAAIEDARLQQCLLAYASDYWLAGVSALPHAPPTNGAHLLISSLDHSLWFHRPARVDDWLLHHTFSPSAGDGLALARGYIFDRDGRLAATTAQEALIRPLAGGAAQPSRL